MPETILEKFEINLNSKDLFTPNEILSESESNQRKVNMIKGKFDRHQRKFSLSLGVILD